MQGSYPPQPPLLFATWLKIAATVLGGLVFLIGLLWAVAIFYQSTTTSMSDVNGVKQDVKLLQISVAKIEVGQAAMADTLRDIKDSIRQQRR